MTENLSSYILTGNKPFNKEGLKNDIEKMDKMHHIEILKIIVKNPASKINENKSGVYINLSFLLDETLEEIIKYVNYVKYQEELLNPIESRKKDLKNTFYSSDDKEKEKNIPVEYITKPNKDNNISIFSY
jgi:hypothetical protein